ncbi:hypothetical protein [Streptomyces qinzhouensis]|uniref:Uncharacterized protein n=1 Tax=Streptomyces qinzhouensis TaxID=2599401 RepID=A0A5B8JEP6_9ACTN|nr:hypothetical protein [Streptomyces qinzhouensis]QDY79916.1 hypothetical protein FQU76_29050 [Streptomyces qinzhouensis]
MSGALRRRAAVGAISLILAVPLGLAAPSAAGAAEKPAAKTVAQLQQDYRNLNGLRLKNLDGSSGVYVIIDGKRFGVPDMVTYNNLWSNWNVIPVIDLYNIPYGGHLSHDAHLISSPSSDTVWLLSNGQKRGITGRAFAKYEFDGNKIQSVRDIVLGAIPQGPNLDL